MTEGGGAAHFQAVVYLKNLSFFESLGVAGFVIYVLAYLLIALRRISGNSVWYYGLNLSAACFVMVSLTASFNLPSALIQTFWIGISLIGLSLALLRPSEGVAITLTTPHSKAHIRGNAASSKDVVIIDQFQDNTDSICIEVDGGADTMMHREIDLKRDPECEGIDIWLDGELLAHVKNAEDVSHDQVQLVPKTTSDRQARVHWISG